MNSRLVITSLLSLIALSAPADARTGASVAATCATCHGTLGQSAGAMPSLAGLQKPYLIDQMRQFREGKRAATVMHQIAKGFTADEIESLAEFFARQKPAR